MRFPKICSRLLVPRINVWKWSNANENRNDLLLWAPPIFYGASRSRLSRNRRLSAVDAPCREGAGYPALRMFSLWRQADGAHRAKRLGVSRLLQPDRCR
jgi:hypothetical protein